MNFTRRTYRTAIRRSIEREARYRSRMEWRYDWGYYKEALEYHRKLRTQINHTRRLQARKRKERK